MSCNRQLLADKFNLSNVDFSQYAVYDRRDSGSVMFIPIVSLTISVYLSVCLSRVVLILFIIARALTLGREQLMLGHGESPLVTSLRWRDPSEGSIWLQRLPPGPFLFISRLSSTSVYLQLSSSICLLSAPPPSWLCRATHVQGSYGSTSRVIVRWRRRRRNRSRLHRA